MDRVDDDETESDFSEELVEEMEEQFLNTAWDNVHFGETRDNLFSSDTIDNSIATLPQKHQKLSAKEQRDLINLVSKPFNPSMSNVNEEEPFTQEFSVLSEREALVIRLRY
jgi:hypothetical protein